MFSGVFEGLRSFLGMIRLPTQPVLSILTTSKNGIFTEVTVDSDLEVKGCPATFLCLKHFYISPPNSHARADFIFPYPGFAKNMVAFPAPKVQTYTFKGVPKKTPKHLRRCKRTPTSTPKGMPFGGVLGT